jgi:hypothetical protein
MKEIAMPTALPPSHRRRPLPSLRPTIFCSPAARRARSARGDAPPRTPDGAAGDERHECPRDEGSPFWRMLRLVLEPTALR